MRDETFLMSNIFRGTDEELFYQFFGKVPREGGGEWKIVEKPTTEDFVLLYNEMNRNETTTCKTFDALVGTMSILMDWGISPKMTQKSFPGTTNQNVFKIEAEQIEAKLPDKYHKLAGAEDVFFDIRWSYLSFIAGNLPSPNVSFTKELLMKNLFNKSGTTVSKVPDSIVQAMNYHNTRQSSGIKRVTVIWTDPKQDPDDVEMLKVKANELALGTIDFIYVFAVGTQTGHRARAVAEFLGSSNRDKFRVVWVERTHVLGPNGESSTRFAWSTDYKYQPNLYPMVSGHEVADVQKYLLHEKTGPADFDQDDYFREKVPTYLEVKAFMDSSQDVPFKKAGLAVEIQPDDTRRMKSSDYPVGPLFMGKLDQYTEEWRNFGKTVTSVAATNNRSPLGVPLHMGRVMYDDFYKSMQKFVLEEETSSKIEVQFLAVGPLYGVPEFLAAFHEQKGVGEEKLHLPLSTTRYNVHIMGTVPEYNKDGDLDDSTAGGNLLFDRPATKRLIALEQKLKEKSPFVYYFYGSPQMSEFNVKNVYFPFLFNPDKKWSFDRPLIGNQADFSFYPDKLWGSLHLTTKIKEEQKAKMLFTILQRSASLAAGLVPEVAANNKGDMNAREWVFTISKISNDSAEPLIDAIERITRSNPRLKEHRPYAKIVQQNSTEDAIQTQSPGSNPNIYLADYLESTQGPGRAKLGQILSHAVEEPLKEFCRLFSDTQTGIKAKLNANTSLEQVLMLDTVQQGAREAWLSSSSVSVSNQKITSLSCCHLATSVAYAPDIRRQPTPFPHYCDTFAHLVVTGKLPNLERLDLTSLRIDLPGMEKLAFAFASGSLPQLRELYLIGNQIGNGGMQAFASAVASGSLPNLTKLNISFNQISDGGMQAFASAVASGSLPKLEAFYFDGKHPGLQAACKARGIYLGQMTLWV